MKKPQTHITVLSPVDLIALKLHQLEQAHLHKSPEELATYVDRWLKASRNLLTERFGPLRDYTSEVT